jgi:SAM-dependent methyltransferase
MQVQRAAGTPCWACGEPTIASARSPALVECPACGLAFQPERAREELRALYRDSYFADYEGGDYAEAESARRREASVRLRFVEQYAEGGRLLELGCAAGYFLAEARAAGFEVAGVEASATMARLARERFGVAVEAGFVDEIALPAATYDVVCAWHVLEHIPEPLVDLQRLHRCLRPGGLLFVEVPNFASVRARREGVRWRPLDLSHHVVQFSPDALAALLRSAGFELCAVDTVPFAVYRPPLRALAAHARQGMILRGWPLGADPVKHELVRAVARAA